MSRATFPVLVLIAALGAASPVRAAEIHDAVQVADLAKVIALLERDPGQVNARDENGRTPLHLAARGTSAEVLALLVARGADLNALDGNGTAPLHSVASHGNAEGVRLLLDRGADVNVKAPNQWTPLHLAARSGHAEILSLLVERKADLEALDDRGRTPLVLAAREMAGTQVVRTLLDLGARIDVADRYGDSALSLAAWRGSAEVVSLLLAGGAALPPGGPEARQLLGRAVSKALPELFARLVEKGADLGTATAHGGTLLSAAAEGGSVPILEALLARGLKVNHRDDNGWTALHFAADMGHRAAIELLLANGAVLDARTVMGQSPLNLAEDNADKDTMALLRARGASPVPPAFPVLTGPYLGQKPPGRTAEVFAPGIVAGRYGLHSSVIFSPDGKEALWALMLPGKSDQYGTGRTVVSRLVDGRWSYPREAVFEGTALEDVPAFHPDGTSLFDMAERAQAGQKDPGKENIWVWEKGPAGWRNPRPVDAVVNSLPQHWQFGVDRRGDLYFSSTVPGSLGGGDIWVSRRVGGRHQKPENLGPSINTSAGEDFPYISPDGRTLLFGRDSDIWVSSRAQDGTWTKARPLGPEVNTPGMEVLPSLSPDGKVLFFSRGFRVFWVGAAVVQDRAGKGSAAEEVEQALAGGGVEKARACFAAVRGAGATAVYLDETELNALGYRLLQAGKVAEAIAVLEMNTETFPGSWNGWDSLGEACAAAGDRERAIACYSKSVELNPANQNGHNALSRLRGEVLDEAGETREALRFQPGTGTGLRGPYLGQTPPGPEPTVFAPGIVSSGGAYEFSIAISPDGREIYFTRRPAGGENTLMVTRLQDEGWTSPEEAAFARGFSGNEPHITPDGRRLYFGTARPRADGEQAEYGIWVVERPAGGAWGDPRYHGPGMYVSLARSGNLYLTDITNVAGGGAIVYPWADGRPGPPRRLGGGVNAPKGADHSFIAPDESYILFDSYHRPGGQGGEGDLWVSFRMPDGSWSEAHNLGDTVNTPATTFCPMVSPDGRYIFYSTNRDIYWVGAGILDELRSRVLNAPPLGPVPVVAPGEAVVCPARRGDSFTYRGGAVMRAVP